MKGIYIVLFTMFLLGCNDKSKTQNQQSEMSAADSENIFVYIERGNKQCENDGLTNEESVGILVYEGIDVLSTTCGALTGVVLPATCGLRSGELIVHEIREVNEVDAEKIGYRNIEKLISEELGLDYSLYECTKLVIEQIPTSS